MTCRNCDKLGHVAAFCEEASKKEKGSVQVQDGEEDIEADVDLFDAMQQECEDENYNHYADLFLCEDQEHRSASFFKSGISGGRIPKEWILLDNQSTTDAFSNPALLRNIREV